MKRIFKNKWVISSVLTSIIFFGCTSDLSDFGDTNIDKNAFVDAPPKNIFAGVVINTLDVLGGELNEQIYLIYSGYHGGRGGSFGNYSVFDNSLDGFWGRLYTNALRSNQKIINKYDGNDLYTNRVQIAKIWKSYVFSVIVSTFGPVPYSEALGDDKTPKFDSEEFIYTDILETLRNAAAVMKTDGDTFEGEPVYNGDITKWIKFANALRLKTALRISEGFPDLAESHILDVKDDLMLTSNADNATLTWEDLVPNRSFAFNRYVFGSPNLNSIPRGNFHFMLNLKTFKDPRLELFHDEASEPLSILEELPVTLGATETKLVRYDIPYYGTTVSGTRTLDAWDFDGNQSPYNGLNNLNYSTPNSSLFFAADMKFNVLTFSELNFIQSEVELKWGTEEQAQTFYEAGIDASFDQYNISDADFNRYNRLSGLAAYKEQDGVKWGTTTTGLRDLFSLETSEVTDNRLDQIVRQRWFAMFYQGHDAWCLNRRTRLIPTIPHLAPDNASGAFDEEYAEVPERMIYPAFERGVNQTELQKGIALLSNGVDNLVSPLKLSKPFTRLPKLYDIPVEFNIDFAKSWYGPSLQDLIDNGIDYTEEIVTP